MNNYLTHLIKIYSELDVPYTERVKVLELATAIALIDTLPFITSELNNPSVHYEENIRLNVRKCIGFVNEAIPVNITYVDKLASAYWLSKYNFIYGNKDLGLVKSCIFDSMLSSINHFSEDEIWLMNKYNKDIDALYQVIKVFCINQMDLK